MIRRDPGARRPVAAPIVPRDRSGDLPPLVGPAPTSPSEALDLAVGYAAAHPNQGAERALVKAAWRALTLVYSDIQRADVVARLSGADVLGDYVASLAGDAAGSGQVPARSAFTRSTPPPF